MAQQLSTGKAFPTFQTTDIWGRPVSTQYTKGKTWWLFHRNSGCPACNIRIHQIQLLADSLAEKGHRVMLVLESQPEYIKSFVGDKPLNLTFVGDPERKLYALVGGQRSTLKLMNSLFHGMFKVIKEGEKIMGGSRKQDGHINTIPCEFIVDQQGVIVLTHYSKFIGDDPELPTVKALFSK